MSNLLTVSGAIFEEVVEHAGGRSAFDFTRQWCVPCRIVPSIPESLATDYESREQVMRMDADTNPPTTRRFGIPDLPTVLCFWNRVVVGPDRGGRARRSRVGTPPASSHRTRPKLA